MANVHGVAVFVFCGLFVGLASAVPTATPQFARQYQRECTYCHSAPPRLNARGLEFVASGYRFREPKLMPSHGTVPVAVWTTFDVERRHTADFTKAFPSRLELISAGPIGRTRLSYFAEWRALSQNVSNRHLLNRSGRFEDLFVKMPVTTGGALAVTAGQFRALNQVDVSQRLFLSEPLAFSSGLASPTAASSRRLTGLRSFSPSGRQPAVRLEYQRAEGSRQADGWYAGLSLPLAGELTVPFTDAASFEFETRLKGVFLETYRRSGLSSVGGHAFLGDRRRLGSVVVTHSLSDRVALTGAVGRFWTPAAADTRYSVGGEYTFNRYLVGGVRMDDRTARGQHAALLVLVNGHLPFGTPDFRQALRLQLEHRVQKNSHVTALALSHVF